MPRPFWSFIRRFQRSSVPEILNYRTWARMGHHEFPRSVQSGPTESTTGNAFQIGKVVLVAHVFDAYVGGIGTTAGISMTPTIPHSYNGPPLILYSCLHRRGRNIKVGDVVTYTHPIFFGERGCKRVIGMPGDFVSVITTGRAEKDHDAVDVEGKWASVKEQVVRVPEGHCWVAGDNLEWSRDSRLYGPLPLALVRAKVLAVVLPYDEAKWLGREVDMKEFGESSREWVTK